MEEFLILILELYSQVLVFSEHDLLQISPKLSSHLPSTHYKTSQFTEFTMQCVKNKENFLEFQATAKDKRSQLVFLTIEFEIF